MLIAFVGQGELGWRTAAQALREFRAPTGFDAVHVEYTPARPTRSRLKTLVPRSVRWRADIASRTREARLGRTLAEVPFASHIHYTGHLGAAPHSAAPRSTSYSVTLDGTEDQKLRDLERFGWAHRRQIPRDVEQQILVEAAFVCCVSSWAMESVVNDYGIDKERVHITPFPIVGGSTNRSKDADWLTFIGNDFERKGGDRLVDWHQRLFCDFIDLHLVSSDRRVKRFERLRGVVCHGELPNSRVRGQVLPRTRLLVLPTSFDQSPLALTEAAAAGVPTVASNLAGIPELVLHEATGLLADPRSDNAFVEAIGRLVSDTDLADRMGSKARRHYETNLCSARSSRKLWELIACHCLGDQRSSSETRSDQQSIARLVEEPYT